MAVFVLILAGIPLSLAAQVSIPIDSSCLRQVAVKIHPNGKITVICQNGDELKGRLASINLSQSHLVIYPSEQTLSLYRISKVEKIQYRKIGPESVAKGVLFGTMLGGLLGLPFLLGPDEAFSARKAVGASAIVLGAGIGLVAGFTQPTTHTIKCR